MTRFEQGLLSDLRANHADILTTIKESGEISEETDGKLKGALDAYAKTFAA